MSRTALEVDSEVSREWGSIPTAKLIFNFDEAGDQRRGWSILRDDLAGVSADWNPREWLNNSRGL